MLPIVQAQRERYRQRNQELEEEKAAAQQQMQVAQVCPITQFLIVCLWTKIIDLRRGKSMTPAIWEDIGNYETTKHLAGRSRDYFKTNQLTPTSFVCMGKQTFLPRSLILKS